MRASTAEILEAVAKKADVSVADLLSVSRFREHVTARWAAAMVLRHTQNYSLPQLAKVFSRDHSTFVHAFEQMHHQYQPHARKAVELAQEVIKDLELGNFACVPCEHCQQKAEEIKRLREMLRQMIARENDARTAA